MCHRFSNFVVRVNVYRTLGSCAAALLLASPSALADEAPNLLTDTWQASIGAYVISSAPTVELNGKTTEGGKVNFDRAIGGGDAFRARLDGQWRFADRHKARFSAFGFNRSKSKTIAEEIEWGDEVYPINARINFDHSFWVVEGVYDYSFVRRENYEIGASIGLHWTSFEASLKLKATQGTAERKTDASVDLPLPVIGLRGLWNLSHNFWLDAQAQYFSMSFDEYDGNLQDYRVFVRWQPNNWVGLGVGYNRFTVDMDVEKDSFDGSLDWNYSGPVVFYSVAF